ncbi:MAG: hypothetical protein AAB384_01825 [Patescibacteria group bacterium]
MQNHWKVALIATLALVGAGCGATETSTVPAGSVAIGDAWHVRIPENYRHEERGSAPVLTDGECLIYLYAQDNKTVGRSWKSTTETQKIGDHGFNLTFYKDNNNPVRMDAHLLETDVHMALDNPAGFVRCETEFKSLLGTVSAR